MSLPFKTTNSKGPLPAQPPKSFTLRSVPETDIYAAPAHGYVWTAPLYHRAISTSNFKSARVNVTFTWQTIYDQGGLILFFPSKKNESPDADNAGTKGTHPQWVKAGIEINDGKVWASVVARENWADWSLSRPPGGIEWPSDREVKAVFEFQRKKNALFVYVSAPDGTGRSMIREPQWVFMDERDDCEARIGVYCCSPDPNGERRGEALEVTFEDLVIEES